MPILKIEESGAMKEKYYQHSQDSKPIVVIMSNFSKVLGIILLHPNRLDS
jgi:hypothetical protein